MASASCLYQLLEFFTQTLSPADEHLDEISVEELQNALDNVDGKKPTQRLLAAITYKNGFPQTELAEWYGVERKTIYNWLTRLNTN